MREELINLILQEIKKHEIVERIYEKPENKGLEEKLRAGLIAHEPQYQEYIHYKDYNAVIGSLISSFERRYRKGPISGFELSEDLDKESSCREAIAFLETYTVEPDDNIPLYAYSANWKRQQTNDLRNIIKNDFARTIVTHYETLVDTFLQDALQDSSQTTMEAYEEKALIVSDCIDYLVSLFDETIKPALLKKGKKTYNNALKEPYEILKEDKVAKKIFKALSGSELEHKLDTLIDSFADFSFDESYAIRVVPGWAVNTVIHHLVDLFNGIPEGKYLLDNYERIPIPFASSSEADTVTFVDFLKKEYRRIDSNATGYLANTLPFPIHDTQYFFEKGEEPVCHIDEVTGDILMKNGKTNSRKLDLMFADPCIGMTLEEYDALREEYLHDVDLLHKALILEFELVTEHAYLRYADPSRLEVNKNTILEQLLPLRSDVTPEGVELKKLYHKGLVWFQRKHERYLGNLASSLRQEKPIIRKNLQTIVDSRLHPTIGDYKEFIEANYSNTSSRPEIVREMASLINRAYEYNVGIRPINEGRQKTLREKAHEDYLKTEQKGYETSKNKEFELK